MQHNAEQHAQPEDGDRGDRAAASARPADDQANQAEQHEQAAAQELLDAETGEITALETRPATLPRATDFSSRFAIATQIARSGYYVDAREAAQAYLKIRLGAELGITEALSMSSIYIIEGKPAISAQALNGLIARSSRYRKKVRFYSHTKVALEFFIDGESEGTIEWTLEDAKRAGLLTKTNWQKYPRAMLFARALSEGFRVFCAELTLGTPIYTYEELGVEIDGETGMPLQAQMQNSAALSIVQTSAAPGKLARFDDDDDVEEGETREPPSLFDSDADETQPSAAHLSRPA